MIEPAELYRELTKNHITFYTGVPDSLLKSFISYVIDHASNGKHVIAVNEGAAVAIAAGNYLATREIGLVYMQNSGLGNATNPLLSLADPKVYQIPILLLIGWRGEPGVKDEPQHIKQGEITLGLLETMEIPYQVIRRGTKKIDNVVRKAIIQLTRQPEPVALVIQEGLFLPYKNNTSANSSEFDLTREEAIESIVDTIAASDIIVSTTGKASRELYDIREKKSHSHTHDFLTVGSMGHASQIALGIALAKPLQRVFCLDGDGAFLMHMGSLATTGDLAPKNFRHIVLNNGVHDSVGGQPTAGFKADFVEIALACGYKAANRGSKKLLLGRSLRLLLESEGPSLLEIRVRAGARDDLGRPKESPTHNKKIFMQHISENRK